MTKNELAALVREKYPQYADIPEDVLLLKLFEKFPEYRQLISPIQRRVTELAQRPSDVQFWWPLTTQKTRDEARARQIQNNLNEATSLHEMDMILEAGALQVPREVLGQIKIKELEHRLAIERYREEARIDLDTMHAAQLQALAQLDELSNRITSLYDQRVTLTNGSDPAKGDKLRHLNEKIALLEGDFSERAKQTLVQASRRSITEGSNTDSEEQRDD